MKTRFWTLALLLGLAPAALAVAAPQDAQEASATQTKPLPSAKDVIGRFGEVTKSTQAMKDKTSMHGKGTIVIQGMGLEGQIEIWHMKPNKTRANVELGPMGTTSQGFANGVAWSTSPMTGAMIIDEGLPLLQARYQAHFHLGHAAPEWYESMETVGSEKFEGQDCYKVKLVLKPAKDDEDPAGTRDERTIHEWFSVEDGLLLGNEFTQVSPMGNNKVTTVYQDYKDVGGVVMSTKQVNRAAMQEFVIKMDSIDFAPLDPSVFEPPADVAALMESDDEAEGGMGDDGE